MLTVPADLAPRNQGGELAIVRGRLSVLRKGTRPSLQNTQKKPRAGPDRAAAKHFCRWRWQKSPRDQNPRHRLQPPWALLPQPTPSHPGFITPPLMKDAPLMSSKSSHQLKLALRHISASFLIALAGNFDLQISQHHEQRNQRAANQAPAKYV